jgi:C-terminal processing protease CtpA/Prc
LAIAPKAARAQAGDLGRLMENSSPLLHSSSQGYLGVEIVDVDADKAQALKLKEARGAIITLIDHDAPAGQIGLKVNDVVLQLNGQDVEGVEQLRRMLREIPAGRKVSLGISRDGNIQTLAVQLADRKVMEHEVWNKIGTGGDVFAQGPEMGILAGGGDVPQPGGFHIPFFGSSLNVGALVEPLTSQMAEYLGVPSGLMVRQVARKSEAAAAGLKAFDVILKVGPEAIVTLADWERALHSNQGKPVQVTVLRDRKQQTLTLQVDSKRHGLLELEEIFPAGDEALMAGFDEDFAQNAATAAEALRGQAEALKDQAGALRREISPEQAEKLRKEAEELRDQLKQFRKNFKPEDFKIDPKQMDQMKQQMEEFRKNFKPEDFKLDPKQMDELRQQMEQLKHQMEEFKAFGLGNLV